jgi:hypothetical protein
MEMHVSGWGKDPIWRTPTRRATELTPSDFPLISRDRGLQGLVLQQSTTIKAQAAPVRPKPAGGVATQINPAITVALAPKLTLAEFNDDPNETVLVAPHEVEFDESRGLWYCDIKINMPDEYFPFVRLALARYQHNSLEHCHLSRIVRAEFIQLTPDRTVSITPAGTTGQQFTVTHTGVTYDAPGRPGVAPFRSAQAGPNLIRVTVEQKRPDGSGNLGWTPIPGDPYELKYLGKSGAATIHRDIVTIPGDRSGFRLIVQEFEMHLGGEDIQKPVKEGRLIFADAIEL